MLAPLLCVFVSSLLCGSEPYTAAVAAPVLLMTVTVAGQGAMEHGFVQALLVSPMQHVKKGLLGSEKRLCRLLSCGAVCVNTGALSAWQGAYTHRQTHPLKWKGVSAPHHFACRFGASDAVLFPCCIALDSQLLMTHMIAALAFCSYLYTLVHAAQIGMLRSSACPAVPVPVLWIWLVCHADADLQSEM